MRAAGLGLCTLLAAIALGCSTSKPVPTPSPTPVSRMSRIAFVSERDGNWDVFVMNADGTDGKNLTNNPAVDGHPSWAPDGSKIAFHSDRDGNNEIYVMNSDGTGVVKLTDDPESDHSPAWSADGSKIAFVSDRTGRTHIWTMDPDGSNQEDLTGRLNRGARWPAWSPDGETLAYISTGDLLYMGPDGTGPSLIVNSDDFVMEGFFVGAPDWSPDGEKLALLANFRDREGLIGRLYTADSEDGYNFKELLPLSPRDRPRADQVVTWPLDGPDERPSWSPDGTKIVYATVTDGDWEIWVADFQSQTATRLTQHEGLDSFPAWEPVGVVPAELGTVEDEASPATTTAPASRQ